MSTITMAIGQIIPFIMEKNFSGALDLLLNSYSEITSENKAQYDTVLTLVSFWKSQEYSYQKKSYHEIYTLWQEFDIYVIKEKLFNDAGIIESIKDTVMRDIYKLISIRSIAPQDSFPFLEKIIYAKALLSEGSAKAAFSFISQLIKRYPSEPEVWALMGKLYFMLEEKKSMLFYREAFFIDPSLLNLNDIRTSFIDEILEYFNANFSFYSTIKEKDMFLHWLAICGILGGFFNIKRHLTPEEESIMSKRIIVYENRYYKNGQKDQSDLSNLLRLYLFKYNYYKDLQSSSLGSDVLKKIEVLSPLVYSKLMK